MGGCQKEGVRKKIAPSFNSECKLMINGCVPRAPRSVGSVTQCAWAGKLTGNELQLTYLSRGEKERWGCEVFAMHTFHICVRVEGVQCS